MIYLPSKRVVLQKSKSKVMGKKNIKSKNIVLPFFWNNLTRSNKTSWFFISPTNQEDFLMICITPKELVYPVGVGLETITTG